MVVIGGMVTTLMVALLLIGRFHPPGGPHQAGHVAA